MTPNRKNALINILFRSSNIIYLVMLGIVLVPMYLQYIPIVLYGYWLATGNIVAWIGDLTPVGIVMQQKVGISFGAGDYKMIGKYIGTSMIISILLAFVLAVILVVLYHSAFHWLQIGNSGFRERLRLTLIFAGVGTLLTLISFGFSGINYGLQLFKSVGYLNLATDLTCIFATFSLLPKYGVYALGLALLVRGVFNIVGNVIILCLFIKKSGVSIIFSWSQIKQLMGDVSFNFFSRIGNLLSKNSQLFFITMFVAPETAVIFKVTKTIPEISKYFIAAPAESILPVFSKYLGQKPDMHEVKAKVSKFICYSIWGAGLILIGFVLLNEAFITLWVGGQFYAGNLINILIVLWVAISTATSNLMYAVFALGDIRRNNMAIFIQSVVFVLLTLLIIPHLGILGVAIALLLSEVSISLVYYLWSLQRLLHYVQDDVRYFLKEVVSVCVTVGTIYITAYLIHYLPRSWYGFFVLILICTLGYHIVLCLASKAFKKELQFLLLSLKTFAQKAF